MPLSPFETFSVDFDKSFDTNSLRNKCAIVTGGSSGLGLGIATALAENGAYVTIADIDDEAGTTASKKLTLQGHHVKFVHTDVTSWSSQITAFKAAIAHSPHATLDIVIPCAEWTGNSILSTAGLSTASLGEDPPEPPKKTIDINVTGVLYTANLAFYYFKATRDPDANAAKEKKHLLLIGSLAGYGDHPLVGDYTASKWAVRGLWKSIRGHSALLGGVRMNLLAPTWINAGIAKEKVKQLEAQGIKAGETEDVVAAVLRCCCDETIEGRAIAVAPSEDGKAPGSSNFDLNDDAVHGEGNPALLRSFAQGVFGEGAPAVVGLTKDDTVQLLAGKPGEDEQKSKEDDDATENEQDKKDNGEGQSSSKGDKPSEDDQIQNQSGHTASSHPPLTSGQHKAAKKGEFESGLHGEGYGKSDEEQNKEGMDQDVPVHGEEIDRLEEMGVQDEEKEEAKKAQDEDEDQVDLDESAEGKEAREKMSDQEEEDEEKRGEQGGSEASKPHKADGDSTTSKKGNGKHASEDDNNHQASKKRKENE